MEDRTTSSNPSAGTKRTSRGNGRSSNPSAGTKRTSRGNGLNITPEEYANEVAMRGTERGKISQEAIDSVASGTMRVDAEKLKEEVTKKKQKVNETKTNAKDAAQRAEAEAKEQKVIKACNRRELVQEALRYLRDNCKLAACEPIAVLKEQIEKDIPKAASRPFSWAVALYFLGINVYPRNSDGSKIDYKADDSTTHAYITSFMNHDDAGNFTDYKIQNTNNITFDSFYASYVYFKKRHMSMNRIYKRNQSKLEELEKSNQLTATTKECPTGISYTIFEAWRFKNLSSKLLTNTTEGGNINKKTFLKDFLDMMKDAYGIRDSMAKNLYRAYDMYYEAEGQIKRLEERKDETSKIWLEMSKERQTIANGIWTKITLIAELGKHEPVEPPTSIRSRGVLYSETPLRHQSQSQGKE